MKFFMIFWTSLGFIHSMSFSLQFQLLKWIYHCDTIEPDVMLEYVIKKSENDCHFTYFKTREDICRELKMYTQFKELMTNFTVNFNVQDKIPGSIITGA